MSTTIPFEVMANDIRRSLETSVDFSLPGYPAAYMEVPVNFEKSTGVVMGPPTPNVKRFIYKVYRCRCYEKDLQDMLVDFTVNLCTSIKESGEGRKCILWRRQPMVDIQGSFEHNQTHGCVSVRFSVFDENWDELEIDSPYLIKNDWDYETVLWERAA